jgi:menaquinone-dependent protoporphyrinogen oxidase
MRVLVTYGSTRGGTAGLATMVGDGSTYFFSSGPLNGSAADGVIPPVRGVASLMRLTEARDHMTFGGRLSPDATGVRRPGHGQEARG